MNLRTSIVLLIALIMVAGWVYFYEVRKPPEREEIPPWFYLADFDDIIGVSIEHEGQSLGYSRDEDLQWYIDDKTSTPVDIAKWGGKVLLLSGPRSRRQLEESVSPGKLADFGLHEPRTVATIKLTYDREVVILMGDDAPVEPGGTYAIIQGYSPLFLIDVTWRQELSELVVNPAEPLWNKPLASEAIVGLDIFLGTQEANFSKLDGDWYIGTTKDTLVDTEHWDSVYPLLTGPSGIRSAIAYAPGLWTSSGVPSAMALPYGISSESTFVRIVYATELVGADAIASVSYLIGDKTPDETGYYAVMDPYPSILFIDKTWVEIIEGLVPDPSL